MKILLIGEYSRLHNSLKEGLQHLGHDVTLISTGDGMKQFPSDILLKSKIKSNWFLKKLNNLLIRSFGVNAIQIEYNFRLNTFKNKLTNYDVVQLINEDPLGLAPKSNYTFLEFIFKHNSKTFLLCCGEDYTTVNYFLNPENGYSVLKPYLADKSLKNRFQFSLKYISEAYKKSHDLIYRSINGVICSDIDYSRAFGNNSKYLGLIPNPINASLFETNTVEQPNNTITIFHGINTHSSIKKGSVFFTEALKIIKDNYKEKVTIIETKNLPYKTYINSYNKADIVLDQVYSYDQGYNALEAMAKGKVVFTGAEQEWLQHYNLTSNTVAINALPDVSYLVKQLEWLINNPTTIKTIGNNAKDFIKTHHDYITIANRYLTTWEDN